MLSRALLFLALLAGVALGGTRDPAVPDEKYVKFGESFRCVQRIKADTGSFRQSGSAVLIQPHWALTAAHVVDGTIGQKIVMDDGVEHDLARVFVHPDFGKSAVGFADIAVCYSPTDFGLTFYTPLYSGSDEVGKAVTISGYGTHGTFATGGTSSDGQRRAGHNRIDYAQRAILVCSPGEKGKLPLEYCITIGDSGGGLFIGNELAGINSFTMAAGRSPNGLYGDESAHARISMYEAWIRSVIESHGLAMSAMSTAGPEPSR